MPGFKLYNILIDEEYFCDHRVVKRQKIVDKQKKSKSNLFRFSKRDIILSNNNMLYNVVERA